MAVFTAAAAAKTSDIEIDMAIARLRTPAAAPASPRLSRCIG